MPESLDRAFTETGARVLYCMPTLQTPTGAITPMARRQAIAEIVRRHDAYLVEDDAYAYLLTPPIPPVSALILERSFYILSFAKCLAPGLRIAAMIAPDSFRDRSINAVSRHRLDGRAADGRSGRATGHEWGSGTPSADERREGCAARCHRPARLEGVASAVLARAGVPYLAATARRAAHLTHW